MILGFKSKNLRLPTRHEAAAEVFRSIKSDHPLAELRKETVISINQGNLPSDLFKIVDDQVVKKVY